MTEKEKVLKIIDREIEWANQLCRLGGVRHDAVATLEYVKTCITDTEKEPILKEPSRSAPQRRAIEEGSINKEDIVALVNILFGALFAIGFLVVLKGLC